MKRLILLIIVSLFVLCGCSGGDNYDSPYRTIRVTGSEGVRFDGCYSVYTSSGTSISESVSGVVPASYFIMDAESISCVFQKKCEAGMLKVEILKEDKVLAQATTYASYGIVSVAI